MAHVEPKYSKKTGELTGYKFMACVGRDEITKKQIWKTKTEKPLGLTPKKELKEMKTLADAWEKEQIAAYEKEKRNPDLKSKDKITLVDFIETKWIPNHVKDGNHTPDTVAFYTHMSDSIKDYFRNQKGNMKLKDIEKETVLEYLQWLRQEAVTKRGNPYGKTTIQHLFSTLRNIMEYAVYIDYIKDDPCVKLKKNDRPRRADKEIDFLDEEQAVQFLSALESDKEKAYWKTSESYLYWKALVNVLIRTALRRGEMVGLKWEDIDKKKLVIHVRRNVTIDARNKEDPDPAKKIHVGETKGKDNRQINISQYLCDLLFELKKAQEAVYGGSLMPNTYVFCRSTNQYLPIYPTEPTKMLARFIKRHKLPNVSPHDLRHTTASLAIEAGASVKEVQMLLGHKDPATTLKFYAGLSEKASRQTIDRIESKLNPQAAVSEEEQPTEKAQ